MTDQTSPPPAAVRWNDWRALAVEPIGGREPTASVGVVIGPTSDPAALEHTLDALAAQTYPRELLDVVVIEAPGFEFSGDPAGLSIRALGSGVTGELQARNEAGSAAEGELLVFLDAGLIPDPRALEAHARWHHATADVMTIGFRADGWPGAAEQADYLATTADLTSPRSDIWQALDGANFGVRRAFFDTVGGFDESFDRTNGGYWEFAHRAVQAGAVLVPEPAAVCRGRSSLDVDEPATALDVSRNGRLEHRVADGRYRESDLGRSFLVPLIVIDVQVGEHPWDDILRCVETALASRFHDLVVHVHVAAGRSRELEWLDARYGADPRVVVNPEPHATAPTRFSAIRIVVEPTVRFGRRSIEEILVHLDDWTIGALDISIPGDETGLRPVEVRLTRALSRAHRLTTGDGSVDEVIARLFGSRTDAGTGFFLRSSAPGTQPEPTERPRPHES